LSNNAQLIANASGGNLGGEGSVATAYTPLYAYMPPTLQAAALSGNLGSAQGFSLAPSASGQLELLAQKSVSLASNAVLYSGISVLDFAPGSLSNLTAPSLLNATDRKIMTGGGTGLALHAPGQLHADDAQPARVIALTGDINGQADTVASLNLPKAAEILAGRDIQDLGFRIQQDGAAAQTLVQAGRDIIDSTNRDHASPVAHVMTGPGLLTLNAERDIDLGNGYGVVTRGNLDNAYLPEGGASVIAVAGGKQSANYRALSPQLKLLLNEALLNYLVTTPDKDARKAATALAFADEKSKSTPSSTLTLGTATNGADLPVFSGGITSGLDGVTSGLGASTLSYPQLLKDALFTYLMSIQDKLENRLKKIDVSKTVDIQNKDLQQFNELKITRSDFDKEISQDFPKVVQPNELALLNFLTQRGIAITQNDLEAAMKIAYPIASVTSGNINVFGSQFKTEQGGSIDLFAPGGSVVAGLVSVPTYLSSKPAADLGLFTVRGGAIRSLVHDDFIINQGRVFTLGGGNITLVSTYDGTIDAGRGTKTAASAPPPLLTTDANGNTKIDISGSIAGSGIGTFSTGKPKNPGTPICFTSIPCFDRSTSWMPDDGNVYLVAKVVDAGDAGIRATGKLIVKADVFLNAGNTSAGGGSVVQTKNSDSPAPAPSNTTESESPKDVSRQDSANSKVDLDWDVEILGLGEAPDKKSGDAQESDEDRKKRAKNKKPASPQT
jgi:hypothetical protein